MSIFGKRFTQALEKQVVEGFTPQGERDTSFRGVIGYGYPHDVFRAYSPMIPDELNFKPGEQVDYIGTVVFDGDTFPAKTTQNNGLFIEFETDTQFAAYKVFLHDTHGVIAYVFRERVVTFPFDRVVYWGSEKLRDAIAERGGDYNISVSYAPLSSYQKRPEDVVRFHLMYLPSFVAALTRWGSDAKVDFDLGIIFQHLESDEDNRFFFSREAQQALIGTTQDEFYDSILFQQRAKLWKLLGESNPLAYNPPEENGKTDIYTVESEDLKNAINFALGKWGEPMLMAAEGFFVPIVGLQDNNGWQSRQQVITRVFDSESEVAEFTREPTLPVRTDSNPVPSAWVGMESEWHSAVSDLKKRFGSPDEVDSYTLDLIEASLDDLKAWW